MKFTLTSDDGYTKITHEFDEVYVQGILSSIDAFLKSSGFGIGGNLVINEDYLEDEVKVNFDNIDLTPYDYETNSTFSAVVDDHINLTEIYPDVMKVDLTGSTGGCKDCTCGKKNAN